MTIVVWKDPLWWRETRLVMDVICAVLRPAATGADDDDVEVRTRVQLCSIEGSGSIHADTCRADMDMLLGHGSYCWQMRR
jgi:hypothetical protein